MTTLTCAHVYHASLHMDAVCSVSFAQVTSFPHVAIIDPRTGACKWQYKFSGNLVPKLLAEKRKLYLCTVVPIII